MAILIALAIPGFLLFKFKMFGENAAKTLTVLCLYVATPILIFSNFVGDIEPTPQLLINMAIMFGLAIVTLVGTFFIAKLVFIKFADSTRKRIGKVCAVMPSSTFLGIPFIDALFPGRPEAIIYTTAFIIAFNLLCWTLVVFTITGDKKYISIKKAFLNPPLIAVLVAMPLFLVKVFVPEVSVALDGNFVWERFMWGVSSLGRMATPLALTVLGINLARIKFKELFNDILVYISAGIKLLIAPFFALAVALLLRVMYPSLDPLVIAVFYIICAMPAAITMTALSERFSDDGTAAAKNVLLSAIICIVTVPLLLLMLNVVVPDLFVEYCCNYYPYCYYCE
ncbi:MAG: AEC family transporter [Firmicutes bacterium]|nr:AEC family transporter [Bacillota bacterium]